MERKRFYITTPIYYPSDKLHIGHTYCTCLLYTSPYGKIQGPCDQKSMVSRGQVIVWAARERCV